MLKEKFDHIPQFSLSKKKAVLDQNLSYILRPKVVTSMLQISARIGCTSLPRVKPGGSFVRLPCPFSWGASRGKMEVLEQ